MLDEFSKVGCGNTLRYLGEKLLVGVHKAFYRFLNKRFRSAALNASNGGKPRFKVRRETYFHIFSVSNRLVSVNALGRAIARATVSDHNKHGFGHLPLLRPILIRFETER